MKYGFIKSSAVSPHLRLADCRYNAEQLILAMQDQAAQGCKLLVSPELGITGYSCGDLFMHSVLLDAALDALAAVREASKGLRMITWVGFPLRMGAKLYNCAAAVYEGRLLAIVPKRNIPNHDDLYEGRCFSAGPEFPEYITVLGEKVPFGSRILLRCAELPELTIGAELCEDLWTAVPPSCALTAGGAAIIVNLSASSEIVGRSDYRSLLLRSHTARLPCACIYAEAADGESTQDAVFSGNNFIVEGGRILAQSYPFSDGLATSEIDVFRLMYNRRRINSLPAESSEHFATVEFSMPLCETKLTRAFPRLPFVPSEKERCAARCEEILTIQSKGLARRLEHTHCQHPILGISGGLDSSLALLAAVRAVELLGRPASDVIAVTMPCFGTTARTKSNAQLLSEALGVTFLTADITKAVTQHLIDLGHPLDQYDVTFENAQARERTQYLMDLSNQVGGLVVGTGDLSELALGWATYNGDHMSMYGVNASIPKTLMRSIVRHAAEKSRDGSVRRALFDILDTPVSPELLPAENGEISQKTEDLVGPYELHDFFLYYMLRCGFSPAKLFHAASYAFEGCYDEVTIQYWLKTFLRRFFNQQFKRSCLPDGPKVGTVSLSPRGDWRMPSDAFSTLWLEEAEAIKG